MNRLNSAQGKFLPTLRKFAKENDLEIKTVQIQMKHVDTPEQRKARFGEGLVYVAPNLLGGRKYRDTCFYDSAKLIRENSDPNNIVGKLVDRTDKGLFSSCSKCPECDFLYFLPVSKEEQERLEKPSLIKYAKRVA